MATKKVTYVEPEDYFSKETLKKFKLGEYAERHTKKPAKTEINCGGDRVNILKPPKKSSKKK